MDIRANADTCKGQECRFFDRCFYYRMRREAQDASILLVNHALFFSDLVMRARGEADAKLLPDYSFVVFDEAHHLETAAAAAFGVAFSSGRLPGLLDKVRRAARQMDFNLDRLKAIEAQGQALFAPFSQGGRPEFFVEEVLGGRDGLQSARAQVSALGSLLDGLATELLKQDTGGQPALKDRIDGLRRQCVRAKEELSLLFLHDHANFVRWGSHMASRGRRGADDDAELDADLRRAPAGRGVLEGAAPGRRGTDLGDARHRRRLRLRPRAAGDTRPPAPIMGSQTKSAITETIVGSPFDYQKNCLLYIPAHLPPPSDDLGYTHQVTDEIIALIEAAQGGAFVLFTSYRALNIAYEASTQSDLPYPILRQGEMPNARLVEDLQGREERRAAGDPVVLGGRGRAGGGPAPGHH